MKILIEVKEKDGGMLISASIDTDGSTEIEFQYISRLMERLEEILPDISREFAKGGNIQTILGGDANPAN